jgi:hypothetical protein
VAKESPIYSLLKTRLGLAFGARELDGHTLAISGLGLCREECRLAGFGLRVSTKSRVVFGSSWPTEIAGYVKRIRSSIEGVWAA